MCRVVLDTNIIRDIGAEDLDPAGLQAAARAGLSIHLSETAVVELAHALSQHQMEWGHWLRARRILAGVVDRREPILLGGKQGLARAGIPSNLPGGPSVNEGVRMYAAIWKILVKAKAARDLGRRKVAERGTRSIYTLNLDGVRDAVAREKRDWISEFDEFVDHVETKMPAFASQLPSTGDAAAVNVLFGVLRDGLDLGREQLQPLASMRLDAFLRVHALLHIRRLRKKGRYNPIKSANDALDHSLLRYLAMPAAICTSDRGLIADVAASRSWQAQWVVTPAYLARPEVIARLQALAWPEHLP